MLAALRARGIRPARVLEPTCGSGAFLAAAAATYPAATLLGIEYQRERYAVALAALQRTQSRLRVVYANAYELDFAQLSWPCRGPLLVVGNPPWITAAALGRFADDVVQPPRSNPHRLRGLAARTGAANFDVAEFLLLKLLRDLRGETLTLALLVKESVARNVLAAARAERRELATAEIVRIDARKWFDVAVDACCLILSTAPAPQRLPDAAPISAPIPIRADFRGAVEGWYTPRAVAATTAGGVVFRQGIKHDAAAVFELHPAGAGWRNGYGHPVDVEPAYTYPLLKAGALHAGAAPALALIVPQDRLGAPTAQLEVVAPRLWRYLNAHDARIAARKSSVYRRAPRFAVFGIGPYSFAPWKVAVAGFYAQPRFRLLGPHSGRPVVLGDTSYFVPFEQEADARAFAALCASPALASAIAGRVARGKRPITKALLDGIDWRALAAEFDGASCGLPALFRESAAP